MITCLEFRRRIGAEPFAADAELEAHRRACAPCARHQDELRAMDDVIRRALEVNPPPREAAAPVRAGAMRSRFLAIAASLVAGIALALVVLVAAPRAAIAREVVAHVLHEPDAAAPGAPLPAAAIDVVLAPAGMRLAAGAGTVSFAAHCVFEGRVVPHLVVQAPGGPVTVLVLAHRTIARPMRFDEQGYSGVVLPAPRGSIAVVGQGVRDLEAVARQVFDAIDWDA
ncbi:MAG: DUF3379 domain-containing protein [Gammaproteobacteria bacterium]|nr:DUF3379 domain-containing protein [Gammaproteobacteria bacterium]